MAKIRAKKAKKAPKFDFHGIALDTPRMVKIGLEWFYIEANIIIFIQNLVWERETKY